MNTQAAAASKQARSKQPAGALLHKNNNQESKSRDSVWVMKAQMACALDRQARISMQHMRWRQS
jgi:hypothetical protein